MSCTWIGCHNGLCVALRFYFVGLCNGCWDFMRGFFHLSGSKRVPKKGSKGLKALKTWELSTQDFEENLTLFKIDFSSWVDRLYTFGDNITHYKTESLHFGGLMNSATKRLKTIKHSTSPFIQTVSLPGWCAWLQDLPAALRQFPWGGGLDPGFRGWGKPLNWSP